jgi:hypothetical protein
MYNTSVTRDTTKQRFIIVLLIAEHGLRELRIICASDPTSVVNFCYLISTAKQTVWLITFIKPVSESSFDSKDMSLLNVASIEVSFSIVRRDYRLCTDYV